MPPNGWPLDLTIVLIWYFVRRENATTAPFGSAEGTFVAGRRNSCCMLPYQAFTLALPTPLPTQNSVMSCARSTFRSKLRDIAHGLWQDHGSVISVELVCVSAIALVGLIVGLTSLRDAAISELSDIAGSVQDFNQCYSFNSSTGHSATTHGSSFVDALDHCDEPEDVAGGFDNCIVLSDPTDETSGPLISILVEGEGDEVAPTVGAATDEGWIVWGNGEISFDVEIPEDGIYTFTSRLWGSQGGPDLPNAAFVVDGVAIDDFDISPTSFGTAQEYSVDAFLSAGTAEFCIEFTNDFYMPPIDRNLFVDWMQVVGPN